MRTNELMLYKHMEEGNILRDMTFLIENYNNDYYNQEDLKGLLYECVNGILEMAVQDFCINNSVINAQIPYADMVNMTFVDEYQKNK